MATIEMRVSNLEKRFFQAVSILLVLGSMCARADDPALTSQKVVATVRNLSEDRTAWFASVIKKFKDGVPAQLESCERSLLQPEIKSRLSTRESVEELQRKWQTMTEYLSMLTDSISREYTSSSELRNSYCSNGPPGDVDRYADCIGLNRSAAIFANLAVEAAHANKEWAEASVYANRAEECLKKRPDAKRISLFGDLEGLILEAAELERSTLNSTFEDWSEAALKN